MSEEGKAMANRINELSTLQDASESEQICRRGYVTPRLLEYGSVAKLTEGSGGSRADAGNNTKNNPGPGFSSGSNNSKTPKKRR